MKNNNNTSETGSSKVLIVKNLAYHSKPAMLRGMFKKFGQGVEVVYDYRGDFFLGTAKVFFQTPHDARQAAMALKGRMFFSRELTIEMLDKDEKADEQLFVVVKGLAPDVTKKAVEEHFKKCGKSVKVTIPRRRGATCYAFIFYDCHEKINAALSLHGSVMEEKQISVEPGVAGSKAASGKSGGKIAKERRTGGRPY